MELGWTDAPQLGQNGNTHHLDPPTATTYILLNPAGKPFNPRKPTITVARLEEHWLAKHVEGFSLDSYHLGMIYAFAEVVGSGVKPLALSPPMTREEHNRIKNPISIMAEEYNIHTLVDEDFLTTKLFNPAFTEGKVVIHFAKDPSILDRYKKLKELKGRKRREGKLPEAEDEIARELGRILGYDEETIEGLLRKPRF